MSASNRPFGCTVSCVLQRWKLKAQQSEITDRETDKQADKQTDRQIDGNATFSAPWDGCM